MSNDLDALNEAMPLAGGGDGRLERRRFRKKQRLARKRRERANRWSSARFTHMR